MASNLLPLYDFERTLLGVAAARWYSPISLVSVAGFLYPPTASRNSRRPHPIPQRETKMSESARINRQRLSGNNKWIITNTARAAKAQRDTTQRIVSYCQ